MSSITQILIISYLLIPASSPSFPGHPAHPKISPPPLPYPNFDPNPVIYIPRPRLSKFPNSIFLPGPPVLHPPSSRLRRTCFCICWSCSEARRTPGFRSRLRPPTQRNPFAPSMHRTNRPEIQRIVTADNRMACEHVIAQSWNLRRPNAISSGGRVGPVKSQPAARKFKPVFSA